MRSRNGLLDGRARGWKRGEAVVVGARVVVAVAVGLLESGLKVYTLGIMSEW